MNLIPGEMSDRGIEIGEITIPAMVRHRGKVTFGLRPERAHLNAEPNGLALDVTVVEELGAQRLVHARLGDHDLTIAQSAEEPVPSGRVGLEFAPEDAFLFDAATGQRL